MDRAPTKVLYLMDTYAHPRAGTEQQVLELVRNLDRSRFKPHIAVFRDSEHLRTGNEFECPVEVLGIGKIASASSMLRLYCYARKLRKDRFVVPHIFQRCLKFGHPGLPTGFMWSVGAVAPRVVKMCRW